MDVVELQPAEAEIKVEKRTWIFWAGLDSVAVLFWLYAIVKVFVFDVDVYLVTLASSGFVWLLNYKLLILLGSILVAMLVTRSFVLGFAIAYVAGLSVRDFVLETSKIRLEATELAIRVRYSQCGNWIHSLIQTGFCLRDPFPH